LGIAANPLFTPLSVYTGELFGVEYLYSERGTLAAFDDVDSKIDDGVEVADESFDFNCCSAGMEDDPELDLACTSFTHTGSDCNAVSDVPDAERDDHQSFDSKSIGGWDKVDRLAAALLESEGLSMSAAEVDRIVGLHHDLTDYDKKSLEYSRNLKPSHGRFARSKSGHVGLEAMKRCLFRPVHPLCRLRKVTL
jgi:hypothetical protein